MLTEILVLKKLKNHLIQFLEAVIPIAETCKINMSIHPDDPPFLFLEFRVLSVMQMI